MHDIESRDQIIGDLSEKLNAAEARIAELEAELAEARAQIPPTFIEKCVALREAIARKE